MYAPEATDPKRDAVSGKRKLLRGGQSGAGM